VVEKGVVQVLETNIQASDKASNQAFLATIWVGSIL
jgi:hypothetical protein